RGRGRGADRGTARRAAPRARRGRRDRALRRAHRRGARGLRARARAPRRGPPRAPRRARPRRGRALGAHGLRTHRTRALPRAEAARARRGTARARVGGPRVTLRIGTRGSDLALWQARHVAARLAAAGHATEIMILETRGDRIDDVPLQSVEGKGFFTKEL